MVFGPYAESVLTNIGINIILTLSMYFTLAVGQLSIAQVGFMAIGAHLATVLTLYLHTPFVVALLAAALVSWLIGAVMGHLLRRLQGLILAFATFAFMEIVQVFFLWTRGFAWPSFAWVPPPTPSTMSAPIRAPRSVRASWPLDPRVKSGCRSIPLGITPQQTSRAGLPILSSNG